VTSAKPRLLTLAEAHARAQQLFDVQVSEDGAPAHLRIPAVFKNADDAVLTSTLRRVPEAAKRVVFEKTAPELSRASAGAWHGAATLKVSLVGVAQSWFRTVTVPLSMSLSQLHDRVLLPSFGVPRRAGLVPLQPNNGAFFFTAALSPLQHADHVKESTAFYGVPGDGYELAEAPMFHFPTVFGSSLLSQADLALFGITKVIDAAATPVAHVVAQTGVDFVWVFSPSDAGFMFTVSVTELHARGSLPRDAVVELKSAGRGGALLQMPPAPMAASTVLQRMARRMYPAGRMHIKVVNVLMSRGVLDQAAGDSWFSGSLHESADVVLMSLFMPFNFAFFRRQLMLHVMFSHPCDSMPFTRLAFAPELAPMRLPITTAIEDKCGNCAKPLPSVAKRQICGGCHVLGYCNEKCQTTHWIDHCTFCCRLVEMAAQLVGQKVVFKGKTHFVRDWRISEQRYAVSKQTVKQDKSADQVDSNSVFLAAPCELELVGTELAELK
jgi:hypothetical protein